MACSYIHDFISGTKIALPRPTGRDANQSFQWDIVRQNESAGRMVLRHLEALEALRARRRPNPTKH